MNKISITIALFFSILLSSCVGETHGVRREITVVVQDENEVPLKDSKVLIFFNQPGAKGTKEYWGVTDEKGEYQATDRVVAGVLVKAEKPGHYEAKLHRAQKERMDEDASPVRKDIVLPKVISPRPLYARKIDRAVPEDGTWIGFDLKVGDWTGGYGDGIIADFEMKFEKEFVGYKEFTNVEEDIAWIKDAKKNPRAERAYFKTFDDFYETPVHYTYEEGLKHTSGKWDATLELRFQGQHEGVVEVVDDYHPYSGLKMPHKAPEDGYRKVWKMEADNYQHLPMEEKGYFMRVREQLDEDGKLISANYAKFHLPIRIDPRGRIKFSYAFNPDANDRNLEFDPDKNLFSDLEPKQRVREP